MDILKQLYNFFPTAVYTGKLLVFISQEWKIELSEHKSDNFSQLGEQLPVVRVRVLKKALNGQFVPGHYEDFQLKSFNELAEQIERYIQFAVGCNIRENV